MKQKEILKIYQKLKACHSREHEALLKKNYNQGELSEETINHLVERVSTLKEEIGRLTEIWDWESSIKANGPNYRPDSIEAMYLDYLSLIRRMKIETLRYLANTRRSPLDNP